MGAVVGFFVGNLLMCIGFSFRDVLWLRVFSVVASVCFIPYYLVGESTVLWQPLCWEAAYLALNAFNITKLILERRPVELTDDQRWVLRNVFPSLTPRDLLRLLSIADWRMANPNDVLIQRGTHIEGLILIHSGNAKILVDGKTVAETRPGQCLGEMSFMTGAPTSADVVVSTNMKYVWWPKSDLRELLQRDEKFRQTMHEVLGIDVARKLAERSESSRNS